jgi:glucose uptake protein
VLINYVGGDRSGNAPLLFLGVALVTAAIILDAMAYRTLPGQTTRGGAKGLVLSVLCGILMSLFYFMVARSIGNDAGKMTAYTANVVFALGILLSNLVFNTAIMLKPFVGAPVPLADYFKGQITDHLWGIVGGCIWGVGMGLNIIAAKVASPAISYGLGQGATLVAALWGVFVWREFRDAPRGTERLLGMMFVGFVFGLALVIAARVV